MSASTSRKSFDTSRLARSRNSGIGLDGSLRRKKSATASSARIASWRDLMAPPPEARRCRRRLPPSAARGAAPAARRELLAQNAVQLCELRQQRLEVRAPLPGPPSLRIFASMLFSAAAAGGRRCASRPVSSSSGISANAALNRCFVRAWLSSGPGRRLSARDFDVAQAEPAVLPAVDERQRATPDRRPPSDRRSSSARSAGRWRPRRAAGYTCAQ